MKLFTAFFVGMVFSLCTAAAFAAETSTTAYSVSGDDDNVERVDINVAEAEELAATIKGVGLIRSQRIIAWREEHGRFQSVDDLTNVRGIGMKIVDNNRHLLTVAPLQPPLQSQ